jgi:hypothetical protein
MTSITNPLRIRSIPEKDFDRRLFVKKEIEKKNQIAKNSRTDHGGPHSALSSP